MTELPLEYVCVVFVLMHLGTQVVLILRLAMSR